MVWKKKYNHNEIMCEILQQSYIAFPHDLVIILNPDYLFDHIRMFALDHGKLRRCIISDALCEHLPFALYLDNIPAVKHPCDLDNTRR